MVNTRSAFAASRNGKGIINLNAEVPDGALNLAVAERVKAPVLKFSFRYNGLYRLIPPYLISFGFLGADAIVVPPNPGQYSAVRWQFATSDDGNGSAQFSRRLRAGSFVGISV